MESTKGADLLASAATASPSSSVKQPQAIATRPSSTEQHPSSTDQIKKRTTELTQVSTLPAPKRPKPDTTEKGNKTVVPSVPEIKKIRIVVNYSEDQQGLPI